MVLGNCSVATNSDVTVSHAREDTPGSGRKRKAASLLQPGHSKPRRNVTHRAARFAANVRHSDCKAPPVFGSHFFNNSVSSEYNAATKGCMAGIGCVLTGTFPEAGGDDVGRDHGKAAVKALVKSFGGRVTHAVSGRTKILIVGEDPGRVKLGKALQSPARTGILSLRDVIDCITDGKIASMDEVLLRSAAQLREGAIAASIKRLGLHEGCAAQGTMPHTGRRRSRSTPDNRTAVPVGAGGAPITDAQADHGATGGAARHTGMVNRSKAEVMFAAHWLAVYGDVSLKTLRDALARGHAMGLVDAVFSICYGVDVAVDYDDGYYHDPGAIPRDVRKTERMLLHPQRDTDMIVVRLRVCAVGLPGVPDDNRLLVVHVDSRYPGIAVHALATALAEHDMVPDDMKARLRAVPMQKWDNRARDVAHQYFVETDELYRTFVKRMVAEVGEGRARRLLNTTGIASRLDAFVDGMHSLQAELKLTTDQMLRIVCHNSAPRRVALPAFIPALRQLRTNLGLTNAQLVAIMANGSAAARVENETFCAALMKLQAALGLSTAELVGLVGNRSAAARVENETFWAAIMELQEDQRLSTAEVVRMMGHGSAAARVETKEFRAGIGQLKTELQLSPADVVVLMSNNSVAARVELPTFRTALALLQQHVGDDGLVRLMRANNVFCSRIDHEFVGHLIRIAVHVARYGFDAGLTIHTLLGKSVPVMTKVRALADHVVQLDQEGIRQYVGSMRGTIAHRRQMADKL